MKYVKHNRIDAKDLLYVVLHIEYWKSDNFVLSLKLGKLDNFQEDTF